MLITSVSVVIYYNVIISWAIYYFSTTLFDREVVDGTGNDDVVINTDTRA